MQQADQLDQGVDTQYWHPLSDGRVQCDLCPRHCRLHPHQRGLCYVRGREDEGILLYSYGRSSGFCIDPIEKKPLNHFYPGSATLSFGTAGCNLACKFCQNWDMSKSREMDTLASSASPEKLAKTANTMGCNSLAFTYNDPLIFLEYAVDVAQAAKALDLKSVAVTAGYVNGRARQDFFKHMDAANIDLKAFSERFYHKVCGGHLQNVLETIEYVHRETSVWLELTTLLIPDENDSDAEIHNLTDWVLETLGPDVPLHFTAFHPDWKMQHRSATPPQTLSKARQIALNKGIHYVYTGNVRDRDGAGTWCPTCNALLIDRDQYTLGTWAITAAGRCKACDQRIPGHFTEQPGNWGARRVPLQML